MKRWGWTWLGDQSLILTARWIWQAAMRDSPQRIAISLISGNMQFWWGFMETVTTRHYVMDAIICQIKTGLCNFALVSLLLKISPNKMAVIEDQVNTSGRSGEYGEQLKEIRSLWRFLQGRANPAILCLARLPLQPGLFRRRAPGTDTNVSNTEDGGSARSPPRSCSSQRKRRYTATPLALKFKREKREGVMRQPWRRSPLFLFICLLCEVLMKCLSALPLFTLNGGCLLM